MREKEIRELAKNAGYVFGMMLLPKQRYTLTDIATRKKYYMKVSLGELVRILKRESEIRSAK